MIVNIKLNNDKREKKMMVSKQKYEILFPSFIEILLCIIFILSIDANGQESRNGNCVKNNIYAQYDIGYMGSLNYERVLGISKNNNPLLLSIGASHTFPRFNSLGFNWYGFPLWISRYYGQNRNHFEGGFGYLWSTSYNKKVDNDYT